MDAPQDAARTGLLFRAAADYAPDAALLSRIEHWLGLAGDEALQYADPKKGQRRTMKLVRTGSEARLDGFLLAGDTSAEAWIKTLLQDSLPAQSYGRLLLVPGSKAPADVVQATARRGRQVCACFNVTDVAIGGFLAGLLLTLAGFQGAVAARRGGGGFHAAYARPSAASGISRALRSSRPSTAAWRAYSSACCSANSAASAFSALTL